MAELDLYCDRVAGAVGRLSVKVFGMEEEPGLARQAARPRAAAHQHLRDVDEDAGIGRLYLPREPLEAAGITSSDPDAVIADPRVDIACKASPKSPATITAGRRCAGQTPGRPSWPAPRLMSAV